jgi:hypothetical protein
MDDGLIEVATSPCRWNGVAVSQDGRIFVSMPRWTSSIQTPSSGQSDRLRRGVHCAPFVKCL